MLPEPHVLGLYVVAALALVAMPGPSMVYVMARSLSQGRGAGAVW